MTITNPTRQADDGFWLKRLARSSAYVLLAGIAVLVISGWGITQTGIIYRISFGLIDRRLANSIHRAINAPVAFLLIAHVLLNMRMGLTKRHPDRTRLIDGVLIVIGGFVL